MSTGTFVAATMRLVPVKFSGTRSGSGPVTLGQGNVLRWAADQTIFGAVQCQTLNVVPGRSLNDVMRAIGGLIGRHESLRTLFGAGASGEWAQQVTASGELLVEVHEAGGRVDATEALLRQRLTAPFALDREWPLRAAVITSDGSPARVLLALTHTAADFASLGIIARDFRRLMSNRTNQAPQAPALQPLDQARLEMSSMARSRAEAAVRYWETTLRGTPQCMLAVPGHSPADRGSRMATLRSRAAALALASIADRTHASQSVVILAAVATLLGLRTVNDRCQITALCANRFDRASRDYVGTIAQDALIAVDLTAGTFDGIIQTTRTAALTAYYHSQYDAGSLWQMISRVGEDRGTEFHRDCVMNDLNGAAVQVQTGRAGSLPDKGDAANAMRDTRLVWADVDPRPLLFYFEVYGLTRHEVSLSVWAEQTRFPAAEVEDFLFAVERLLVAAERRNVPARDIGELASISPVLRDTSWRRIDSCWVEMPAVQFLLDDVAASVPGVDAAQVFCTQDVTSTRTADSLVAYVAASGNRITPRILHAQCRQRLAGRPTAMAPAWYVICDRTPDDPACLGSWRHLPVRVEGSGRA
ncbi:MAG TPA: condensation domain-containing protein [Streptosporangiaceae bacterium]|nr:condensation domain-containing protein [Streptosporangiaceae bacterium]